MRAGSPRAGSMRPVSGQPAEILVEDHLEEEPEQKERHRRAEDGDRGGEPVDGPPAREAESTPSGIAD